MSEQSHTTLSTLPDELLIHIVQCIPGPRSHLYARRQLSRAAYGLAFLPPIRDYQSVACVSRRFHWIAISARGTHFDHDPWGTATTGFIETIFKNPSIARNIHSVKEIGTFYSGEPSYPPPDQRQRSAASVETLCRAARSLHLPHVDALTGLIQKGHHVFEGVEAALVIALSPNLRSLALNSAPGLNLNDGSRRSRRPPRSLQMILYAAQGRSYGCVHQFEHLHKLRLNMAGMHVNVISSVMRLTSLKQLVLFNYMRSSFNLDSSDTVWDCPPKISGVSHIRLENVDLHNSLANLLASCRSLESLAVSIHLPSIPDRNRRRRKIWVPSGWPGFISELQRLQPGLRALSIGGNRDGPLSNNLAARLSGLEEFRDLEYLSADLEFLCGGDFTTDPNMRLGRILPQKLKSLVISKGLFTIGNDDAEGRWAKEECNQEVYSLLHACQKGLLGLESFAIQYYTDLEFFPEPGIPPDTDEEVGLLEAIDVDFDFYTFGRFFKECGIDFDYVIEVQHDQARQPHDRLILTSRFQGDEAAEEYINHLSSMCNLEPHYELSTSRQPESFNNDIERFLYPPRTEQQKYLFG